MSRQKIPWLRLFVEGVVIVGSILLAFGIDAGWERRLRSLDEQALMVALQHDMIVNRTRLEATLYNHAESLARVEAFLGSTPDDLFALPEDSSQSLSIGLWGVTTFTPLDGLLGGRTDLSILEDLELRQALGSWSGLAAEQAEDAPVLVRRAESLWLTIAQISEEYLREGTLNGSAAEALGTLRRDAGAVAELTLLDRFRTVDGRKVQVLFDQTQVVLGLVDESIGQ
jgi:hypothetical protein